MFIPVAFSSVNSAADLAAGRYQSVCSLYGKEGTSLRAILFEYTPSGSTVPTACDVVLQTDEGIVVRAGDFVWLSDRSWRDSAGRRANDLQRLLPSEVLSLKLLRSFPGEPILVG